MTDWKEDMNARDLYDALKDSSFSFTRSIVSRMPTLPSGRCDDGLATFSVLSPEELLYSEKGNFHTLAFTQRYIYHFSLGKIDIFFVKRTEPKVKDYLFLSLKLSEETFVTGSCDSHLCVNVRLVCCSA